MMHSSVPTLLVSGQAAAPGIYRNLFTGKELSQTSPGTLAYESDNSPALYIRLTYLPVHDADARVRPTTKHTISYSTRKR